GAVDGGGDVAQQVGEAADVVLVAVGDDDAVDPVRVLTQEREVGQDQVDARHLLGAREHEPAVDDDDAPVDVEAAAVPADLPQPAQEHDPDGRGHATKLVRPQRPAAASPRRAVGAPRHAALVARSRATSSSIAYSSPVSTQSSNWMTPRSVKRSRSHPSAASSSPSFLQLGTIF